MDSTRPRMGIDNKELWPNSCIDQIEFVHRTIQVHIESPKSQVIIYDIPKPTKNLY
jgi:hypothetical protein